MIRKAEETELEEIQTFVKGYSQNKFDFKTILKNGLLYVCNEAGIKGVCFGMFENGQSKLLGLFVHPDLEGIGVDVALMEVFDTHKSF